MDIPWLVCNKCFAFLKNLKSEYFITNTGNLYCADCAAKITDPSIQLTPHSRMPAKLKPMFHHTLQAQYEKMMKMDKFQEVQAFALARNCQDMFKWYQKAHAVHEETVARAKKHHKMLQSAKAAYAELCEKARRLDLAETTKRPMNFFETTPEATPGNSTRVLNSMQNLQLNSGKTNAEAYRRLARNQEHQASMQQTQRTRDHQTPIQGNRERQRPMATPQSWDADSVDSDNSPRIFGPSRGRRRDESSADEGYVTPIPGNLLNSRTPVPAFRHGGFPQRFDGHQSVQRQPRHLMQSKRVYDNSSDSEASETNTRKQQRTPDGVFRIPPTPKSVRFADTKYSKRPFS